MFETNSIIRASAGTGKTFALATRFIRLMLIDGVEPETIVALTFSRAAAQEIYTKILDRLCRAASEGTDGNGRSFAENEWDLLLEDFHPDADGRERLRDGERKLAAILAGPPPHGRADFARLLRKLVDTQHLGAIATLDSFILKIVRNFPKEMGIENAVTVLDPVGENVAVMDAVRAALAKTDRSAADVGAAFVVAQRGDFSRQCLSAINTILVGDGWRNFVQTHPECIDVKNGGANRWTVQSMAKILGVDLDSKCPDLSMIPFNDMGRKNAISPEEKFVRFVHGYDGTQGILDAGDHVVALMRFFWDHPDATSYNYKYHRDFKLNCGKEGTAAIRGAIRHLMNLYLKRQLEIVEAKIRLVEAVEREYGRMTRRMGKLTFSDFTAYSAEEEFSARGIALRNVEFRFDSKFDHWALDEFQDTSELQWRCLRELVNNAAEEGRNGGERTAMAVGDMKQSIYTWRGASARPFEELASWPAFTGFEREFSVSHRYGPNIAGFVNRVFGADNIRPDGIIPATCTETVNAWRSGWHDHISHEAPDYVKVVAAAKDGDKGEDDEILPTLAAEIKALWERHEAEKSVDTVGVLVRGNTDGLKVAEYLRKRGMEVVWEGLNPCSDDPLIQSVLALLKVADHPGDTAAWRTASELIDIRSVILPDCGTLELAAAAVALVLTQQGLARTLKDWSERMRESGRIRPDGLTAEKLRQLVELSVSFEERPTGGGDILEFIDFVAKSGRREIASSHEVIRILTIHRSKGLGIDHVFVPLFESDRSKSALDRANGHSPLFTEEAWVLSHLQKGAEQFNSKTKAAYDRMCNDRFAESLRTYYVALTRAKKSMVVVLPEEKGEVKLSQGLLMRDLVKSAVGSLPFEAGKLPPLKPQGGSSSSVARPPWLVTGERVSVERIAPSRGAGINGIGHGSAELFNADYGAAAKRGTDAHAAYAKIEWIDPSVPGGELESKILAGDFREAFMKPSNDATVWREWSYELCISKTPAIDTRNSVVFWETGRFDRVVFSGTGEARRATIYDFKTNRREAGEGEAAFAERMRKLYRVQTDSYRRALSRLTQIPVERIGACLLLEETQQSVAV